MIYSDFMKSLRYGNPWYKLIDSDCYFGVYPKLIDGLLARANSLVRLACLSDQLDTCLGWSLSEGDKLHYVFVKLDQRNQGIGQSLIPKDFLQVTHLTQVGQAIREAKFPETIFNPF